MTIMETERPWPVAVFAHNEERNILACLESLKEASSHPLACYVLANACTDHTEALVAEHARSHPNVHLVSIQLGDKANAWNVFVHELAPAHAPFYFFIDGDVRASPAAIDLLVAGLEQTPHANAASALPRSGRNVERFRHDMLTEKGVAGNLYALRGSFVERIRDRGVRMPVGIIGEDALVGAMVKWDLRGDTRWDNERVKVVAQAGFEFEPMSYRHPWAWKKYLRRRVRYSIRGFQNRMLGRIIQPEGFEALPRHVKTLYRRYPEVLRLRWRGLDTLFDWLALREIERVRADETD
jgi:glycosyltransferase involved in cell wall biosynthesis